jgi:hypothetical protein
VIDAFASPDAHIVHLVGSCVETTSGVRFQSSGAGSEADGSYARGASPSRRGELLTAEALRRGFPRAMLWVVQITPTTELQRTRVDREQVALLRVLGAQLMRLGVPAVLVVPALPARIAMQTAADALEGALSSSEMTAASLLGAIDRARARLHDVSLDANAIMELWYDLCAYVADEPVAFAS